MSTHLTHRTLLALALVGIVAFGYPLIDIVASLNSWQEWNQPALAAKILRAGIGAVIAVASAAGLNISMLAKRDGA